ncbi:transposase family protein [Pseudoalteromonas piscicida]|nr:transposase family protein [Pseudoalteromonas piscicida]
MHLEWIEDPISDVSIKHNLVGILFLTLSAVLSGADGWMPILEFGELQLDWLRHHHPFQKSIPKRHCIANIIKVLDTDALLTRSVVIHLSLCQPTIQREYRSITTARYIQPSSFFRYVTSPAQI